MLVHHIVCRSCTLHVKLYLLFSFLYSFSSRDFVFSRWYQWQHSLLTIACFDVYLVSYLYNYTPWLCTLTSMETPTSLFYVCLMSYFYNCVLSQLCTITMHFDINENIGLNKSQYHIGSFRTDNEENIHLVPFGLSNAPTFFMCLMNGVFMEWTSLWLCS
jgi:hypothetical protein